MRKERAFLAKKQYIKRQRDLKGADLTSQLHWRLGWMEVGSSEKRLRVWNSLEMHCTFYLNCASVVIKFVSK